MSVRENAAKALCMVLPSLKAHLETGDSPVILGLTGVQGSGKSTWAAAIVDELRETYHYNALSVSLDDFYYTRRKLDELREVNPENALLRTRGVPGTHDKLLVQSFLSSLRAKQGALSVPSFDKSAYGGQGDRRPVEQWVQLIGAVDILVFEGWCVGFTPITSEEIDDRRRQATDEKPKISNQSFASTLIQYNLDHLNDLNNRLRWYCEVFMGPQHFHALTQLDTACVDVVYRWRLQQERSMVQQVGHGMRDEAVVAFIQSYMPAYELYLDQVREGFFRQDRVQDVSNKAHVRVILGEHREVVDMGMLR